MSGLSPINLIGLFVAIGLDVFGIICAVISATIGLAAGEPPSFISDIIGTVFFTVWLTFKEGGIKIISAKRNRKRIIKFLASIFGEVLPTGALPLWTIFVISEIKSGKK